MFVVALVARAGDRGAAVRRPRPHPALGGRRRPPRWPRPTTRTSPGSSGSRSRGSSKAAGRAAASSRSAWDAARLQVLGALGPVGPARDRPGLGRAGPGRRRTAGTSATSPPTGWPGSPSPCPRSCRRWRCATSTASPPRWPSPPGPGRRGSRPPAGHGACAARLLVPGPGRPGRAGHRGGDRRAATGPDARLTTFHAAVAICGRGPRRAGGTLRQPWRIRCAKSRPRRTERAASSPSSSGAVLLPSLALSYVSIDFVPELAKGRQAFRYKQAERTLTTSRRTSPRRAQTQALEAARAVGADRLLDGRLEVDRARAQGGGPRLGHVHERCGWRAPRPGRRAAGQGRRTKWSETPREILSGDGARAARPVHGGRRALGGHPRHRLRPPPLPLLAGVRPPPPHPRATSSTTSRTRTSRWSCG